jgi:hypothetical protein
MAGGDAGERESDNAALFRKKCVALARRNERRAEAQHAVVFTKALRFHWRP